MIRPETLRSAKWLVATPAPLETQQKLGHLHPVLVQVLFNRGLTDAAQVQAFLDGRYLASTDPFLLADMDKAVARIRQAIENDELIVVYGDFDADGVTSTVLLTQALRGLDVERRRVQPYIPHRVDEGYGLNFEAMDKIKALGAGLVITVDCGIRSVQEVAYADELGLDMIVTDHHSLGPHMPEACAVINPKRHNSAYPEKMLAGVGIAYKLAEALYTSMPDRAQVDITSFLDLVALGTVADLAPLLGENRRLVMDGLVVLNQLQRPGLGALAAVAGLKPGAITAESIGFGFGPRINAAGRLEHAYAAAKLLAVNNQHTARDLAHELNELNRRRRTMTAEMGDRAEMMVNLSDPILIVADEGFASGVVGLVASRLAEKNYRPAIILEKGPEESRGSCRSIPEFHITAALDETADLLVRHGGHAQAAGFTVRNEHLQEFTARMLEIAAAQLDGRDLAPTIEIDAQIALDDVDWALLETLSQLEPTGMGNPTPVFMSSNVEVMGHRAVGQNGDHLQLQVSGGNGGGAHNLLPGIAFRQGAWADHLPQYVDIVYTIGINEYNGRRTLQLMIQDIRPAQLGQDW
jgi:single-stranded-DNA-specific exonuclease